MHLYEVDVRWPIIVSAFEALFTVGDSSLKEQFAQRVGVSCEGTFIPLEEGELRTAYSVRSKLVHAEGFLHTLGNSVLASGAGFRTDGLYSRLEDLLRRTLKERLIDPTFAVCFDDDKLIQKRWPFVPNRPSVRRTRP